MTELMLIVAGGIAVAVATVLAAVRGRARVAATARAALTPDCPSLPPLPRDAVQVLPPGWLTVQVALGVPPREVDALSIEDAWEWWRITACLRAEIVPVVRPSTEEAP